MKKIIENMIPPVSGAMVSPFCSCLSSLLLARKKYTLNTKNAGKHISQMYDWTLTASGLAFGYIYKENIRGSFDKTEYYTAYDEEWIKFALNFGKCNYRIVPSFSSDLNNEIINSIDRDVPVLAEGLCGNSWCLITGYSDNGRILYGYNARCANCSPCSNCVKTKIDGFMENGIFYMTNRTASLKRIIVIDDFKAEPYDYRVYISHWLSTMQQQSRNGFLFGAEAYDAMIHLLEDDAVFENATEQELIEIYRFVFANSFIPECRHCLGMGLSDSSERKALLDHMGFSKLSSPVMHEKMGAIKGKGFEMHNLGWTYWAALSDKRVYPIEVKKYFNQLKSHQRRVKAATILQQLKEKDTFIMNSLEDILELDNYTK
jgi:hypothetical protein